MPVDPWTPENLVVIAAIFLLGGAVKGVVGLGLPTVTLTLLTIVFGLKGAMVMMIVPSVATNVVQAVTGGGLARLLRRLWPMLALVAIGIWAGTRMLAVADVHLLAGLLGLVTLLYGIVGLVSPAMPDLAPHERWLGPVAGAVNGVITGLTGSSVMPGVPYFQSLGMARDELIQAMGLLFCVSALVLGVAMAGVKLLPAKLGLASLAGLAPAFAGMWLGLKVRERISQATFRRILFASLLVLGGYMTLRAFGAA
ncbi:MAG: sulfite exporter TauE/SafE family protein [Rhodospirillaceae bacterium]